MKDELIAYVSQGDDEGIISESAKSLEEIGSYCGESRVTTSYELLQKLSEAVKRSNLILVLISTGEFIRTKKIVCRSLGIELARDEGVYEKLGRLRDDSRYALHDMFPKGAGILYSPDVLFSGYYLRSGEQCIIFSPIDVKRTSHILDGAGIKINVETKATGYARFIGVKEDKLSEKLEGERDVTDFKIKNSFGELILKFETSGDTTREAKNRVQAVTSSLSSAFGNHMYSTDRTSLVKLYLTLALKSGKHVAIAESENAGMLVRYLAEESNAGEVCKVVRLSSSKISASLREEVAGLAKKARDKSGYDYSVALGDMAEDGGRAYIYGAYANERGILTKCFWRHAGEDEQVFKVRCAKELVLIAYNDVAGKANYGRKTAGKTDAGVATVSESAKPDDRVSEEERAEIEARKSRVAPEMDKSDTRKMMWFMIAVAAVVVIIAVLICREPSDSTVRDVSTSSSTTVSTTIAEPDISDESDSAAVSAEDISSETEVDE